MTDHDRSTGSTGTSAKPNNAKSRAPKLNRKIHRIGVLISAAPLLVVIISGLLLQLKKDWSWVQPGTMRGSTSELVIDWEQILTAASSATQAEIQGWDDIDRLDVRPSKGMLKVRSKNSWEVQIDTASGEVLQTSYRRSDLIESIHDGSWFGDPAKLWIFLPTAIILFVLWITGVYLWLLPYLMKRRRRLAARDLG